MRAASATNAKVRNVRCLALALMAVGGLWAAGQEAVRYPWHAAFSMHAKKASLRIASAPSHHDDFLPSRVLTESSAYWLSAQKQVRDQAFVFELDSHEKQLVTRVEWKTCHGSWAPAGLVLEAKVGEEWRDVAKVPSEKSSEWQAHDLTVWLQSKLWRVTFTHNHGYPHHLRVYSITFMAVPMTWPFVDTDHREVMNNGLWSQMAYTDLKVISGSSSFPAHRAVLAAASPAMEAMVKEADGRQQRVIHVEDVGAQSVQDWLAYIYTGEISRSADFGLVVLGLAHNITGLVERAGPVALRNLQPENVLRSVRMLRNFTDDPRAALPWKLLEQKVHESPNLLRAMMLES